MLSSSVGKSSLMETTRRPDIVFVSGQGSWLTDSNGKKYLDFSQGWAVNCLGHSPEIVARAVADQARRLINPGPAFFNEPVINLADLLVSKSCFGKVFFANSGAEANEGAIKLARKWGSKHKSGAYEIVTFVNAFHGRTLATMSASGKAEWEKLFEPKVAGFPKAKLNDISSVEAEITDKTVAVMLEPIQGEAGVIPAEKEFLQDLRELASDKGILLIFDEIQTGIGRTGHLFAYEEWGIEPDIATLGKGLGGGFPISALCAREEYCCFEHGDQGGTYNGNPLAASASLAVLKRVTERGFLQDVRAKGEYLFQALEKIADRIGSVRGRGLLAAIVLKNPLAGDIVADCLKSGLIINAPKSNVIRLSPSLEVTRSEIDLMAEVLLGASKNINSSAMYMD